jgi:hypothetical protein
MALYEFVVWRINILRFLFGMKLPPKRVDLQAKGTPLKEVSRTM